MSSRDLMWPKLVLRANSRNSLKAQADIAGSTVEEWLVMISADYTTSWIEVGIFTTSDPAGLSLGLLEQLIHSQYW